jgi:hypothetical protein
MEIQPNLTNEEWEIIIRLLEQEQEALPTEIHHTHSTALRHELQERRQKVDKLLNRLKNFALVSSQTGE